MPNMTGNANVLADRRAFLARGVIVPPAMIMLLSTSLVSPAIAASGGLPTQPPVIGGGGGGSGDDYPGPGPVGGGGGGGSSTTPGPAIGTPYFDSPTGSPVHVQVGAPSAAPTAMPAAHIPGGGGAPPRALRAPRTRIRAIAMAGERG